MAARFPVCLALAGASLISAGSSRSEVIHGFQRLGSTYDAVYGDYGEDAFDFVTQAVVVYTSDGADLYYGEWAEGGGYWFETKNCAGTIVDIPLADLELAPELTGTLGVQPVVKHRTFVVRTGDGVYAKFAVRELYDGLNGNGGCCSIVIEYYIQTDGSPNFGPLLAVESTTWGRVKAFYR